MIKLRWQTVALLLCLAGILSHALNERSKTGYELTTSLNGAHLYVATINDTLDADGGISTATEYYVGEGANVYVYCEAPGFFANLRAADSYAIPTRMMPCSTGEKFPLGLLSGGSPNTTTHVGGGYVSWASTVSDGGLRIFNGL